MKRYDHMTVKQEYDEFFLLVTSSSLTPFFHSCMINIQPTSLLGYHQCHYIAIISQTHSFTNY